VTTTQYFGEDDQLIQTTVHHGKHDGESTVDDSKSIVLGTAGFWGMTTLVLIQLVLVTMVYGPIAAFLVELFPTRIRYTSMSLPYHIGNGIFGGLTPFLATMFYQSSRTESNPGGDPLAGLWYPIIVAGICFVVGMIFLSNRKVADVHE
jgi:MHS family proline/betaine transporter-like MFS transporter